MSLIVGLVVAVASGALAVSVDRSSIQSLPSGTVINDVPVGGLDFEQAVVRVRDAVEGPLREPVVLEADGFELTTTAWDLGFRVDADGLVETAFDQVAEGNVVTRLGDRILGPSEPLFVDAAADWADGNLDQVLARAERGISQAPERGELKIAANGFLDFTEAHPGQMLDVASSREAIMTAVQRGASSVRLVTAEIPPDERDESVETVILVRTGENMLYLYERGVKTHSWPVATGSASHPTPTGIHEIINKIENPSWYNPGSDWARGLPRVIGPGPNNPLGTKALQLDAPAILIHATSDRGSIGYSASHGCIRMTEEDEAELFEMVPVGTRVAVVEAGPPRSRGSNRPDPDTPAETAAVVF